MPSASVFATEQPTEQSIRYVPEIHGTFRTRYELETEYMENRFQVRNARLSLSGKVAPIIDYYVQADFCDKGKYKMLDAYGKIKLTNEFSIQAGQMRVPFSVDATRSPHSILFSNRSFIGKQVANIRAVGVKAIYRHPNLPLNIEAGVFNPQEMGNHQVWGKTMDFSGKVNYKLGNVKIEAGFKSHVPDSVWMNFYDGSISWAPGRCLIEGEYVYKHYSNSDFDGCHAYNIMANYFMPVKAGVFNQLSFHGRFDGMTDHSDGTRNEQGQLYVADNARNRITIGATLSYIMPEVKADIRFNYENYFYGKDVVAAAGNRDKIVLELIVRF